MARLDDLFSGVLPFVYTAEELSFGRAAARLGVTTAAVSKAVARLEEELGVRLLARTSRAVALTPEGAEFLARCREAVAGVEGAREAMARARRQPAGEVRVSVSLVLTPLLLPVLGRLGARYPRLSLRLEVTDRVSRLVDERIDVALRVGPDPDSSLVGRTLRRTRWATVAAPAYLARHPPPATPEELWAHRCLRFVLPSGRPRAWSFLGTRRGPGRELEPPAWIQADNGPFLVDAALAGLGVLQALDFMVEAPLREGRLVELLPELAGPGPPVRAVAQPARARAPAVRAVLDALAEPL